MNYNSLQKEDLVPMTKKELYSKFAKFGRPTVRTEMNSVIVQVRGVSLKEAKDQKVLKPGEVAELEKRFA